MAVSVKITEKGIQPGSSNVFYVVWKLSATTAQKSHLDKFTVKWKVKYKSGGAWFDGSSTDVGKNFRTATFTIPDGAYAINVWVNAYSKTHKVGKKGKQKDAPYWTSKSSSHTYIVANVDVPSDISAPSASLTGRKLKLTAGPISNAETNTGTSHVEWQVRGVNQYGFTFDHYKAKSSIVRNFATSEYIALSPISYYQYRARAYNSKSKKYGNWTDYSEKIYGPPQVKSLSDPSTVTTTTVAINFSVEGMATGYTIEYQSTNKDFNVVTEVSSKEIEERSTSIQTKKKTVYIEDLQPGTIYYFRVRASNSTGQSGWSGVKQVIIGAKPAPPTTWSDINSATLGGTVALYWNHNAQDGSSVRYSKLDICVNGEAVTGSPFTIDATADIGTSQEGKVQQYSLAVTENNPIHSFSDSDKITWKVQTQGVYEEYSDWSETRTITVYQPPTVNIDTTYSWLWDEFNFNTDRTDDQSLYRTIFTYPVRLAISSSPLTQTPLSYHLTIIADEEYTSHDEYGNEITIAEGTEIYSGFYDISEHNFTTELTPNDVMLEDGVNYTAKILVYMDSGLSAEDEATFETIFPEEEYSPEILDVEINEEDWSAMIYPVCHYLSEIIEDSNDVVNVSGIANLDEYDRLVFNDTVTMDTDDTLVLGSINLPNVTLDIYRIEANGNYVKINEEPIPNDGSVGVPDPHPALDYARYRVVARTPNSSRISYEDYYAWEVGCSSIVIQWNDSWNEFEYMNVDNGDFLVEDDDPLHSAILILPYNIDVSESYTPDTAMVEYIGRKYPVSYYGTQRGQSASWSTEIPADDEVTLNTLRRLADWMGDVYVREPTGTGYWAHITVSMSLKHKDVLIPVSLSVSRVEGGA